MPYGVLRTRYAFPYGERRIVGIFEFCLYFLCRLPSSSGAARGKGPTEHGPCSGAPTTLRSPKHRAGSRTSLPSENHGPALHDASPQPPSATPHTHAAVFLHGRAPTRTTLRPRSPVNAFPSFRSVFPQASTRTCAGAPHVAYPQWLDVYSVLRRTCAPSRLARRCRSAPPSPASLGLRRASRDQHGRGHWLSPLSGMDYGVYGRL